MKCVAQAFRCLSPKAWICEAGLSDLSSALPEKKKKKVWCWALGEHKPKPCKVRKGKTQTEAKLLSHKLSTQEKTTDM